MTLRIALLALTAGTLLSTAAFAATEGNRNSTGHPSSRGEIVDRCSVLESQYDNAAQQHPNAAQLVQANGLASQGTSNCQANEVALGTWRLERALRAIGVRPAA